MSWIIKDSEYCKDRIVSNGNKFLIGNGYFGYRGTMEEYGREEKTALNLAGVYDKEGNGWRETVNAPNPLFTTVFLNKRRVDLLCETPETHSQILDLKNGVRERHTKWQQENFGIKIDSEVFANSCNVHLLCMKYSISFEKECDVRLVSGIDCNIWDINGPHLKNMNLGEKNGVIYSNSVTGEKNISVSVAEYLSSDFEAKETIEKKDNRILHNLNFRAKEHQKYNIFVYATVFTSLDCENNKEAAVLLAENSAKIGYDTLKKEHIKKWSELFNQCDIIIDGDEKAQTALRYSIYQILILSPQSQRTSIAARGLSGQTYKGAVFWDTEMFMLPFFLMENPKCAERIIKYRYNTLDGARRKAAHYGFKGAFYAWESQESGDDACSDYNVTDVFTKRKMRTYFKDKQIHISADVAYAVWNTFQYTLDDKILTEGGAEIIFECAKFFCSYVYFKESKNRYELIDVIGPDEYHERVNNNAFTNKMVYHTLKIALKCADYLNNKYNEEYGKLVKKLNFSDDIIYIRKVLESLYIPQPDSKTGVIEQFDGYYKLEDCSLSDVRSRLLDPKEYWGGAYGVASDTRIIKQADVIMMLYLFTNEYSESVKKANWEFYEPRTEHGSSLSSCMYALLACDINKPDWGYKFFLKSAEVDLNGDSKQYAGSVYIGGTHPAASGGAWMVAVFGFAGLKIKDGEIHLNPKLPKNWNRLAFKFVFRGQRYKAEIDREGYSICKI